MKLFLFLILLPAVGLASPLKVFSMNLHCGLDDWEKRVDVVIAEVLRLNPDVIGFQEVCYNDKMNMEKYIRNGLERGGYPVRSHLTVDTHRSFVRFQEQLLIISRHEVTDIMKGDLPSPALLKNAYVGLQVGSRWFVTTHLHFALPSIRESQYKELASVLGAQPVILFGDLNSNPEDPETSVLSQAQWVPFFDGPTYPAENPEKTFDGFWMTRNFHDEILATTIERHFLNERSQPSDHLGISLNILYQ